MAVRRSAWSPRAQEGWSVHLHLRAAGPRARRTKQTHVRSSACGCPLSQGVQQREREICEDQQESSFFSLSNSGERRCPMKRCAELLGGRGKLEVGAHSAPGDLAKVSRPDAAKHAGLVSPALEEEVKTKKARDIQRACLYFLRWVVFIFEKERKKTDNPREGWEDGTPPPHRDFRGEVWC